MILSARQNATGNVLGSAEPDGGHRKNLSRMRARAVLVAGRRTPTYESFCIQATLLPPGKKRPKGFAHDYAIVEVAVDQGGAERTGRHFRGLHQERL